MAFAISTRKAAAPAAARRSPAAVAPRRAAVRARYTITMRDPAGGEELKFECAPDQLLLDAAEAAGADLPFLCRSGTCCACTVRAVGGELEQPGMDAFEPEYQAKGYALMCKSYPRSDLLLLSNQEQMLYLEQQFEGNPPESMVPKVSSR